MSSASGGTLFVAHGSPSLLEGGIPVHKFLTRLGQTLPRPRAILCISSHWETAEPCLTATRNPETLTDYEGTAGPAQIDFRCSGDSNLARRAAECLQVAGLKVTLNHTRGIDHAVWDPLRCMCPSGDVAVVEMSVQPAKPAAHHYEIGQALAPLTKEGYLVMGSGLAVHNLKHAAERADVAGGAPIWAQAFDEWLRSALLEGRYEDVVNYRTKAPFANLAHPTPEHLLPLIVALGAGGPAPRTHAINTGFGFASNSQACFYFQCQSDSLEADPVASALGVNALPLCQLLSASLSKRTVPVHRPKTKRKMLASSRPAPMLVSEAHLSALQKCVLEQAGGANPGAKKSPLEERLEHVLAAKQSPQLETLTRSVSLVKRTANQGLTGSAQPSTQQQQFLDSIRAQRPVSESLRSVVNPAVSSSGFQFGEGSRESLGAGEAFGGRSQTDQQFPDAQTEFQSGSPGLAWAITGGVSNPVNNPLRGVASNPGSPVTSAGGGANAQVPPITRTHSAPLQNVPRPGALQQTLEALFRESGNAGQSSDSSSGGQPVRMEQKHAAQSSLDGSFLGLDRIGYGLSPGSQGFGGSPGWRLSEPAHSGTERDRADQGGFAPRNEAASHQQEAASGGLHPGVLEGLNSQQRATSGGAFRGGGSPGFAESSFGEREGGGVLEP
ncbi:hypothetical protein KFL_001380035 [Klebsormidium nitens]|uniref:Extradiol ring-cleavage dioxygenase class III enzyme subunit B domain-containing protein n=1 Tax=Klebsormidium nitens TaxID=105231 RepID=A0A1Y1HZK5_KLENI|nr:hypothetical protein KFL_001380035 [Klebsormidium nitens]|eukprot:GAQ83162.1 hypothetical protein KFL_001380035 [Klebsormidium nitens]